MCKNCKESAIGIQRQTELDAAIAECQLLNVNPRIAGFLTKYAHPAAPRGERLNVTSEERAALERYNAAQQTMKKLHEDYIWSLARADAQQAKERGVRPIALTHSDPQRRSE